MHVSRRTEVIIDRLTRRHTGANPPVTPSPPRRLFTMCVCALLLLAVTASHAAPRVMKAMFTRWGANNYAIATNPVTNRTYIVDLTGLVYVIDGSTQTQIASLQTTGGLSVSDPRYPGIGVNPLTNKIYVYEAFNLRGWVIDGETNVMTELDMLGLGATSVAVNPVTNKVYFAGALFPGVVVVDGNTNESARVNLASGAQPRQVVVNPVTNRVYMTDFANDKVIVLNGAVGTTPATLLTTITVRNEPLGIAVNPVTNKIYVEHDRDGGGFTVIDGATHTIEASEPSLPIISANKTGNVSVDPVANRIWFPSRRAGFSSSREFYHIEGATNTVVVHDYPNMRNYPSSIIVNSVTNQISVQSHANTHGRASIIDNATNTEMQLCTTLCDMFEVGMNTVTNNYYYLSMQGEMPTAAGGSSPEGGDFVGGLMIVDADDHVSATTAVGTGPVAVAVNPVANRVYVANGGSNNVTVIDASTGNSTATVPTGASPAALATDPVNHKIYVANSASNNLTVIDGANNGTTTVAVGANPRAVVVDPFSSKVFVANQGSNNVTIISADGAVAGTVAVGTGPRGLAVNPVTQRLFVANEGTDNVTVIDGSTNASVATVAAGTDPVAVAVNRAINRVYVANGGSNNVTVIDGSNNTVLTTVAVGTNPRAIAVNALTNKVYVANFGSNNVTIINGADHTTTTVAGGTNPSAITIDPVADKVYVTNAGSNNFIVIDGITASRHVLNAGTAPGAISVNPVDGYVFVANQGGNNVTFMRPSITVMTQRRTAASLVGGGHRVFGGDANLSFTVSGNYSPINPALSAIYYRAGDKRGRFTPATGTAPGTATVNGLLPGENFVTFFATDIMFGATALRTGAALNNVIGPVGVMPIYYTARPAAVFANGFE